MTSKWTNVVKDFPSEEKVTFPRWEEDIDENYCNPDKLLLCPYDPSHKIRACRFPYHLIKCRKNHPQLASKLRTCPFNARHLMSTHELSEHMSTCLDRRDVNTDYEEADETLRKFQVPVHSWTVPACDEDWDQEEEQQEAPRKPFNWTKPVSTSSLTYRIRAPRVLPWKTASEE